MYVKLFGSILDSSIWAEPAGTRLVWITMLAMADAEGYVRASRSGLTRRAFVSREECDQAITTLESPDPESGTPDDDGRRIEAVAGGWVILNHAKYREIQTQQQLNAALRQRKHRALGRDASRVSQARHARHATPASVSVEDGEGKGKGTALVKVEHRTVAQVVEYLAAGVVDRMDTRREEEFVWVQLLFAYWAAMTGHPNALFDPKRAGRLKARLRENYNIDEHLYVVDGALKDRNLMGENDRGTKYDGIETLYRDRGQVERLSVLGGYTPGKQHPMAVKYLRATT